MKFKQTTFKQLIELYYEYRQHPSINDWDDVYECAGNFIATAISSKGSDYLKSLSKDQFFSLIDRFTEIISSFPSAFPYGDRGKANLYTPQINKLVGQPHSDGYYSLWQDKNKILLGTFYLYGENGKRKDITTTIYLDSTNANLLVDIKIMTQNQQKVTRFCFPACNNVTIKRPKKSYYMQADFDDIENIIFTDRFDPFHVNNKKQDDHTNNFPLNSSEETLKLFNKYFTSTAPTPHMHFYYESVCSGQVVQGEEMQQPKGNTKSLAINLINLSKYINDLGKALKDYDNSKPLPEILKNDLGMPYLAIAYGRTIFNDSYFIERVKNLPTIDDTTKQNILTKLRTADMVNIGIQFFAEDKEKPKQLPQNDNVKFSCMKSLKKLSIMYKFINEYAEVLTAGQQRSLISAINDGLNQYVELENINTNDHMDEHEENYEPIL